MAIYISLLRGINVSGQKKIKMADLKNMYEELGFSEVVTYIQSGNVLFSTKPAPEKALERKIKKAILDAFGYDVPVLVLTYETLERLAVKNPYSPEATDLKLLHMTLLSKPPEAAVMEAVQRLEYPGESFKITPEVVYLHLPNGYGRTKLNNNFFEAKLKVSATTRNLKTINKLLELAQQ
jgi:uncharacterized protein (DUF1697 family)